MQSTLKPSSPKRKSKIGSGENKKTNKNEVFPEMPVAPIRNPSEEVLNERTQNCQEFATQQHLEACANFLNKIRNLQHILELDILACDAKWTLFVSAAFSYRYDIMLRPFPPQFATEQMGYDINSLISIIQDVPKLCIVLQILIDETYDELSGEVIELLHWVLFEKTEPILRLVEGEELIAILSSIDDKPLKIKPTHVFKVTASEGCHAEKRFRARTRKFPLKLAFMSNKLDTYYSILQNGFLQNKKIKNQLQLSTDLQTIVQQSSYCAAWGASQCGSIISCIGICEFAFNAEEDLINTNENDECCVNICLNSSENIRLRYLVFYGRRLPRTLFPNRRFFAWIYNYRFSFSLLSYVIILLTIGVANSGKGEIFKHFVAKQFEVVVAFCKEFLPKSLSHH